MAKKKESRNNVRFISAFMMTWEVHKTGQPSDLLIDAYWKALEKFTDDEIESAFGYALTELKFFPKPVELIRFIESGPGDIDDVALVQADQVINAIKSVGYYGSVTFDDPVTMAVVTQGWGGWMKLCEMRDDEIKWFRKDFVQIYRAYSNQGIRRYGHLVGYHEEHNAIKFPEHVPKPIMIGNYEKAQKILEYKEKPKLKAIT